MTDPFETHLPVEIGNFEKAYVTIAVREKMAGKKQLRSLNLITFDFKAAGIREPDWALAALTLMAARDAGVSMAMLQTALEIRFSGTVYDLATAVVGKVNN